MTHVDYPHVDYPHHPGFMLECAACMSGPCMCTESSGPCASVHCETEPTPCEWFACKNDATGITQHWTKGYVPTCDRCAALTRSIR